MGRFVSYPGGQPTAARQASSPSWNYGTGGPDGRNAKDTVLRNLPSRASPRTRCSNEFVALACELLVWTQMIASSATPAAGS